MCDIQVLSLRNNQIGDPGITALADALGNGALPALQHLELYNNQIGDVGMTAFAGAVSKGALDHLTVCWRPTALFPCLETWHTHSTDSDVLFDVLYAGACAQLEPNWQRGHHRFCHCSWERGAARR